MSVGQVNSDLVILNVAPEEVKDATEALASMMIQIYMMQGITNIEVE